MKFFSFDIYPPIFCGGPVLFIKSLNPSKFSTLLEMNYKKAFHPVKAEVLKGDLD